MSGIYIPGIEMPENCDKCLLSCDCPHDQSIDGYMMRDGRPRMCPLISVPPHGPLVDALDIINTFPDEYVFTNEQARALTNYIIPADKEGNSDVE